MWDELHDDEFGTFVCWHRRRNLGKVNYPNHEEFLESLNEEEVVLKIPVYIHDHGGFVLSTSPFSDPWDSGQVGVWVFTSEQIAKVYGEDSEKNRETAREGVDSMLTYINDLASGNVWGFEIEDFDGDVADSCWGFVGDDSLECMKEHIPKNLHTALEQAWENRYE